MNFTPKWKCLSVILFLFTDSLFSRPVWENNGYKIYLEDNTLDLYRNELKIVGINSFAFNFIRASEIKLERVSSDTVVFRLVFSEGDGFHENFPSEVFLSIAQYNNTFHFSASHTTFNHVTIELKDQDEHYFGLIEKLFPQNSKNPDLRGNVVDVEVQSNGSLDYSENYASAYSAFYMSNLGYGSFFDTFSKGKYKLGINGITEIYHQTGKLDWYIFYGPAGDKIHREYYRLIGRPKYIPLWACGPVFWRDQNNGGKEELLDDIQKFTDLKIPLTACFVDRPYSNGGHEWSKMDFNNKFSEPGQLIKTINEKYGLQFMTWVGPLTFFDNEFPGLFPLLPNYMDLTNPAALKEFENRLIKNQYSIGVKGHKMDRADENFPATAVWYDKTSASEVRNKYIYLYSKVIDEFLTNAHGKDNFNFARAAFHRVQPFLSAVWGGDSRNNWHGMSGNMANAIRCGFMGFPVWGNDTGGYLGEGWIDEMMYMRWLQWSAWNGLFEIKIDGAGGSGSDRAPWKYSKQLQNVFRSECERRMQLLPYVYSCANTSYSSGVMMKPLAYAYPEDANTYSIWDEYIFGDAFLVAPIFSGNNTREVYLPEGTWYEFHDLGKEYSGPIRIHQKVPLERIPVFIKGNSIYVTGDIYRGNSKLWQGNIEKDKKITIHLFPGKVNDSTDFTYVDYQDNDKEKTMLLSRGRNKIDFTSPVLSAIATIAIKCAAKPSKVSVNGKYSMYNFNETTKVAEIKCKPGVPITVEVKY